ncbi:hypothetical protein MSAN_00903900 [Mycena sanguinolenta]|uniref:Uncharacterized protein n=1 Tax=Mycena sanguinolenta TaxID=230812 RepID=A0A8H6YXF4_9AGAR|nr:hypothetical protein MSAN_00903900 [Mycena sanguinolenta]
MPVLPNEIVSDVASKLPSKTLFVVLGAVLIITAIGYMLPLQLAHVLATAMIETKKVYDAAHEMGLRSPAEAEMDALKFRVSAIVQQTVRSSESWRATLYDFLRGRTFILLYHIYEVKSVRRRITISGNSLGYVSRAI